MKLFSSTHKKINDKIKNGQKITRLEVHLSSCGSKTNNWSNILNNAKLYVPVAAFSLSNYQKIKSKDLKEKFLGTNIDRYKVTTQ